MQYIVYDTSALPCNQLFLFCLTYELSTHGLLNSFKYLKRNDTEKEFYWDNCFCILLKPEDLVNKMFLNLCAIYNNHLLYKISGLI